MADHSTPSGWTAKVRNLAASPRWKDALFAQQRRLRLRYRLVLWLFAVALLWGLRGLYFPLLIAPLIADHRGDETEILVVEAWYGVSRAKAEQIATLAPGRRVMILLDEETWLEDFGFDVDRAGVTRRHLERAGVRPDSIEIVPMSVGDCEIGCTAARAHKAADLLRRDGVATATLVSQGLHSSRSCYAYRKAVGPSVSLDCYATLAGPSQQEYWQSPNGMVEVAREWVKMGYYVARGMVAFR